MVSFSSSFFKENGSILHFSSKICFKSFFIVSPAIDFLLAFMLKRENCVINASHNVSFPDLAAPDMPIIGKFGLVKKTLVWVFQ